MKIDLLICNGLIIKSLCYDFNALLISQFGNNTWFNMVYHKPNNGKLNLMHLDILSIWK